MKRLDAKRTAVVVVDVQRGLFCTPHPPGDADAVVAAINRVLTAARAAGAVVVLVQQTGNPGSKDLEADTPEWQLHPDLALAIGDQRIRKRMCDAFYQTELDARLRERNIHTIILAGYATDFCVDSTLRNAVSREYEVVIVADGHTTNGSAGLSSRQIREHHNFVWGDCLTPEPVRVVPAADLVFDRGA
jgi:nicotinamidase-related amidase